VLCSGWFRVNPQIHSGKRSAPSVHRYSLTNHYKCVINIEYCSLFSSYFPLAAPQSQGYSFGRRSLATYQAATYDANNLNMLCATLANHRAPSPTCIYNSPTCRMSQFYAVSFLKKRNFWNSRVHTQAWV